MFERLASVLPQFDFTVPFRSEADLYGASSVIARQLGLDRVPQSTSSWYHGWLHYPVIHSYIFSHNVPSSECKFSHTYLVGTKEHEETLRRDGYQNARAVGCPYIYVNPKGVMRMENSLLIMPQHTVKGRIVDRSDSQMSEEGYFDSIRDSISAFDHVAICVHSSCFERGLWVETARKLNIQIINGADTCDCNALDRMRVLFESFSHVTTNAIGSHVAYAAYTGAKVSWYGLAEKMIKDELASDVFYQMFPEFLDYMGGLIDGDFWENEFHWLRVSPESAALNIDWGRTQLGEENRVSGLDLAALLGWSDLGGRSESYRDDRCTEEAKNIEMLKEKVLLLRKKLENERARSERWKERAEKWKFKSRGGI